jgi:extracellular factor (EF) 3-hydroxypalmitic acid methyl ester biosynthesis protein
MMEGSPFSTRDVAATGYVETLRNKLAAPVMGWVERSDALERATAWLDDIYAQMKTGADIPGSMVDLHQGLSLLRRKWDREEWRAFCLEVARPHPLCTFLCQCPFTRHGLERPRGYAGDAALIDYLYSESAGQLEPPGSLIYHFMYQQPSPRSVRERRQLLAREIEFAAERVRMPRMLSVACGHLREAEHAPAVAEKRVGELIAFDQDPLSLAEVARQHPGGPVRTVCGSVRSILLGRTRFDSMDLVYSAGLYDYLAEGTAQRLTRLLFGMLRPGGRLVVGNFANCPEAGYLEAFMDWWLVYRDEAQVQAFTAEIAPEQIASQEMFRDSEQNVIYLVLTRR